jgi:serine/threonine-protein kinase
MERERWQRVEQLFASALALPAEERAPWVRGHADEDLAEEVLALLAADAMEEGPLEGALRGSLASFESTLSASLTGRQLGPYRLLEELGQGGSSIVYLAERADGQYQQKVAIKLLHGGTETEELLARFQLERQILASLDHPNIARLLDAGTTGEGRPYFVMEFVDGQRVDTVAATLPLERRLQLFRTICATVQHAHRNLLIHRDLKPSNILVTADGTPKLLDFGIAKPLAAAQAEPTVTVARRMTPSYASPEQLRGEVLTTATDVYSLGVLLYRLLTGRHPYLETSEESYGSGVELARRIAERRPQRPSQVAPPELRRVLRGDLDNIVYKAMAPQPEARYGTPSALAEDLWRWEARLPVSARSPTVAYRLRTFVRRHRWAVAAGVAAFLVLGAFAVFSHYQYRQAVRERDTATRTLTVLEGMLELSEPAQAKGPTLTARELLEQGTEKIELELAEQPEIRAHLWTTIGRTYVRMGLYEAARPLLEEAVEIFTRTGNPEGGEALHRLADALQFLGDYEGAEARYREALDLRRHLFGPSHPQVAESLNGLADALHDQGNYEASEPLYREALELRRELFGPSHLEVASSLNDLAVLYHEQADLDRAEPLYREALELRRKLLDPQHTDLAITLANLAALLRDRGALDAAEPLLQEAVAINRQVLGETSPAFAFNVQGLAMLQLRRGNAEAAVAGLREVLAIQSHREPVEHPDRGTTLHNLGLALEAQGDLEGALEAYRDATAMYRTTLGERHPWISFPLTGLGQLLLTLDRPAEAEEYLREAVQIRREAIAPDHWRTAESESLWGAALVALGQRKVGMPLLENGYRQLRELRGEDDTRTQEALDRWEAYREDG